MAYEGPHPLPVKSGGTGDATLTNHGVLVGAGTAAVTQLAVASTGQGLMGNSAADPSFTGSPSYSGTVTAATGFITTTGNVALPNTNGAGTQGEITFGGNRWVSNYGTDNTFVGESSGNTTLNTGLAVENTGIGKNSLLAVTDARQHVAVGFDSFAALQTGTGSVAIGDGAASTLIDSNNDIAIGQGAMSGSTVSGGENIGVGSSTFSNLNGGLRNVAVGAIGLIFLNSGSYNTALGYGAGIAYNTSESSNIVVNHFGILGDSHTIRLGTYGTGNGEQNKCYIAAAYNNFGIENTFVGEDAGNVTLSGADNASVGYQSLKALTTGTNNAAFGHQSMLLLQSNDSNTAVGANSLAALVSGSNNIALGYLSAATYNSNQSSNIVIGNLGNVADNNTIRIGTQGSSGGQQNRCFIAGIDTVNVGSTAQVVTELSGQLGTAVITAGTNISVTPTANVITIASTGAASFSWSVVTGATQAMAVNKGYIANNAGTCVMTLPSTAAVGDILEVTGINNATGWQIAQNAGQIIHFGTIDTTTGAGGSLASVATRDSVRMVCVVANTQFNVLSSVGNISIV